jgi:Rrf2 family protein
MSKILAISEANAIAFHGMVLIAKSNSAINAIQIAEKMNASKHHVSKVMQRLVKSGIISSTRGPSGGFFLIQKPETIKLIDILESVEGKVTITQCPIDTVECPFGDCLMGGICYNLSKKMMDYIEKTTLADIINNINEE